MSTRTSLATAVAALAAACGSSGKGAAAPQSGKSDVMDKMMGEGMAMGADEGSTFGPLEVGADWQTYTKVNREPVTSPTHGGRLVDTYVNDVGLAAYKTEDQPMPVGTVLVKTSMEVKDGTPTGEPGPVFVMQKREAGFNPDHEDWYFAIRWESPPERWKAKVGGPFYWRSPSKKVDYCWQCHENYDRFLGQVPADKRAY